jgi:hypothetical protein
VIDAGLEIFLMRPLSKAKAQQHLQPELTGRAFELSMEGLSVLLPHLSDRVLLMEPAEMMQLILQTELPLTDLSKNTQEQCRDVSLGSIAIICDEVSGDGICVCCASILMLFALFYTRWRGSSWWDGGCSSGSV